MKVTRVVFSIGFILSFFAARSGTAQTSTHKVVMVASDLNEEIITPVLEVVRTQLRDIDVEFHVVWVEDTDMRLALFEREAAALFEDGETLVVFGCDLSREGSTGLYMSIPNRKGTLIRHLGDEREGGLSESIGIVVRSTVESILAGITSGTASEMFEDWETSDRTHLLGESPGESWSRSEGFQPKEKYLLSERTKRKRHFVAAAYAVEKQNSDFRPTQGFELGMSMRIVPGWHAFLGYRFFYEAGGRNLPVVSSVIETGSLVGHAHISRRRHFAAIGGRRIRSMGRVEVGASVGVGLDFVTEKTRTVDRDPWRMEPGTEGFHVRPAILPALLASFVIVRDLRAFLVFGGDLYFHRTSYSVSSWRDRNNNGVLDSNDVAEQITVSKLWVIRPSVRIGLSWGLF